MSHAEPIRRLRLLRRIRQGALDEARRTLAEALNDENRAQAARDLLDAEIRSETLAAEISAADAEVEAFARWLPGARAKLARAEQTLAEATTATGLRRAELKLVRAAAEAVDTALDHACAERRRFLAATQQREIQDRITSGAADPTHASDASAESG